MKTVRLLLYGDIEQNEVSARSVAEALAKAPDAELIEVGISSAGGSVAEGTAIYNLLKRHKAKVRVFVDGIAASIASVIAMAGDEIIMGDNALMMVHNCWALAIGNASELRKTADDLDKIMSVGKLAYLKKAGDLLTAEQLDDLLAGESYLTAGECYALGLADKVAGAEGLERYKAEVLETEAERAEQNETTEEVKQEEVKEVSGYARFFYEKIKGAKI